MTTCGYTAIYHHHKVRALECMFRSGMDQPDLLGEFAGTSVNLVARLLDTSEYGFWALSERPTATGKAVRAIRERHLLKRCLVLDKH